MAKITITIPEVTDQQCARRELGPIHVKFEVPTSQQYADDLNLLLDEWLEENKAR